MISIDQSRAGEAKAEAEPLLWEEPRQIRDGNSDLNQKIELVLRKLCRGRHAPLLLRFWTRKEMDSSFPFVLQTQSSHSVTVTPNDTLTSYWLTTLVEPMILYGPPSVSMWDAGWSGCAFANLSLPVYSPAVSEPYFYEECFVGMLQIVSNSIKTCLQFFKDTGVCDLFQKEGLICSNVVPQRLGMQFDVSTQGREVPSNDFVDNTEQFTPKRFDVSTQGREVPSNDFVDNTEQFTPERHNVSTQGNDVSSNDFVDNTEQFTPEGVVYDKNEFVRWARDVYKNDVLVIRSSKDDKIYFRCERHGESPKKKNGQTSSKKCNCPFQIVGSKKKNGRWSLRKIDGSHNH